MKKACMVALALIMTVALVTTVFAQAKPEAKPAPAPAAAPEKKADKPDIIKVEPAKVKTFKGEFVSKDEATKTIVVKGEKGDMTFDVAGVKKLAELKAGDKVMVSYGEKDGKMVAKNVVKQAAKKEKAQKKEEAKPADKPAPTPAATPAPAPAPAKK